MMSPLCLAVPARAQLSAGVSLESDYRFRGISLSDARPTLSMNVAYDHVSGVYAGAAVIAEDTTYAGVQALGFIENIGYATRRDGGWFWDIGINNQSMTKYAESKYSPGYTEIYTGISMRNVSVHVYYSPKYFLGGASAVYFDLNGNFRPADQWRLFGHIGAWAPLQGPSGRRERYDLRVGVAREFGRCEIRLALTGASPIPPPRTSRNGPAVVVGGSYFF